MSAQLLNFHSLPADDKTLSLRWLEGNLAAGQWGRDATSVFMNTDTLCEDSRFGPCQLSAAQDANLRVAREAAFGH